MQNTNSLISDAESIIDTMEQDEILPVVLSFSNQGLSEALQADAKLATLAMYGSSADDIAAALPRERPAQRRQSRSTAVKSMQRRNTKNIAMTLSQESAQSRGGKRSAKINNLWINNSAATNMGREQIAGLRKFKTKINSVVPDLLVRPPQVFVSSNETVDTAIWGLSAINAPEAWISGARGAGVKVSVIDTGIARHEALRNVTLSGEARFVINNGVPSFDKFVTLANSRDRGLGVGHGTHVAGTIGGKKSEGSLIGVAPDVELFSASVFDGRTSSTSAILAGIQWSLENGADVMNLSLGAFDLSGKLGQYDASQVNLGAVHDMYEAAIIQANKAGCLVVIAAGNDGEGSSSTPGSCLSALTIGAMAEDKRCAGFSGGAVLSYYKDGSYSQNYVKPNISAPGVHIYSASQTGGYATISGTSMATPCVAGVAALIMSSSQFIKGLSSAHHRSIMTKYVLLYSANSDLGEHGADIRFGQGVIDAQEAVRLSKDSPALDRIYTRLMNSGAFD